jgi:membrane protein
MRAMSLVYTTLLSVVPLLAFSFLILKGFGVFEEWKPHLITLLTWLGAQGEQGELITNKLFPLVDNVKGSVLGAGGAAIFLYTAISTVQKVEESFNYVWSVAKPRSFGRRFSEYLVVLIVGPFLMITAMGILTSIQSVTVVQYILNHEALGPIFVVAGKLVPYVMISGVFTFLYLFMPNTKVKLTSALAGGVAGGFMWATVGAIFTTFILYASRTLQIYAGFAVAITTLVWLYLNWLILLIGAQLAFYYQQPAYLRNGRQEPRLSNATRERLALNIMLHIGAAFRDSKKTVNANEISERISIPSAALTRVSSALEDAGLLLSTENENLLPGREMSRILLADILAAVRLGGEAGSHKYPRWSAHVTTLGDELDDALIKVVGEKTLADLLDEHESS